jgi:hypothetical protein
VYNLPSGAIAWWWAQGNAADSIGGNDGTLVNGTTFGSGVFGGQAFHFDSSQNQGVFIPDSPSLDPTAALTLEAWVNPSSLPNAFPQIIRKDFPGTGNMQYALALDAAGRAGWGWVSDGVNEVVLGGSVPLNSWSFLVGTYDGSTIRMYVNGTEVASAVVTHPLLAGTGTLAIGREWAAEDRDFDGLIAEPAIFNRALSAGEIQAQYQSTVTPAFDSLAGPTITYGTPSVTLSGHIAAAGAVPPGSVDVTLNGVTLHAAIDPTTGNFATAFSTASLPVSGSPYAITYSYAGAPGFDAAADNTKTLTITKADQTILPNWPARAQGTSTVTLTLTSTSGLPVSYTVSGPATLLSNILTITGLGAVTVTAHQPGDANFNPAPDISTTYAVAPASLCGVLFKDFNEDGFQDFGELGAAGVQVQLTGADFNGTSVSLSATTGASGYYQLPNLLPGTYTVTVPGSLTVTKITVGLNGNAPAVIGAGNSAAGLALAEGTVQNVVNFGLVPAAGDALNRGQTAGIGFWNNKNGQALLQSLNGGAGTQLGDWLAATLPDLFGATGHNLAGSTNVQVAGYFQVLFATRGDKLEAQVLATALSVYVTNSTLAGGSSAAAYGFTVVAGGGAGLATFNVGQDGAAVGQANGTTMTLMDILLAVDRHATQSPSDAGFVLYAGDQSTRGLADDLFGRINDLGGI